MSFKIKLKVKSFLAVVSALTTIYEEAAFIISPEGMKTKAMDPSHHEAVIVQWKPEAFDSFESQGENKFGFRIDDMEKVMKRFDQAADMSIEMEEGKNELVLISGEKKFQLNIFAADIGDKIPEDLKGVEFKLKTEIETQKLLSVLKDMAILGEFFTIQVENATLSMFTGGDTGRARVNVMQVTDLEPFHSQFNIDYLNKFINSIQSFSDKVTIEIGNDVPIQITIPVTEKQIIKYFLSHVTD